MAGDDDGAPCPGPGPVIGRVLQAPKLREFTLAELWAATRGFKLEMVLGEGGFGFSCSEKAIVAPRCKTIEKRKLVIDVNIFELITTLYQVTSFHFTIGNLAKILHFLLSTVKCEPRYGFMLHLSHGALGESKKSDNALMNVKIDDQKLAIGTLSVDKNPHIQFDLVFDKEFELSHTSKTTSVFFTGYKVEQPFEEDVPPSIMDLDSEDEDEELNVPVVKENGKADGEKKKSQEKAVPYFFQKERSFLVFYLL
eukprot:XP_020403620.1 uncharacterized protein LOC103648365 [Zea mays]